MFRGILFCAIYIHAVIQMRGSSCSRLHEKHNEDYAGN